MNKNRQECLKQFKVYIQGLAEIKKDLERIRKIIDAQEKYVRANSCSLNHSGKYSLASGHYNNGKLWEVGGCRDSLNDYASLIQELDNLKAESLKKLKASQCQFCQKKHLTNPYIHEKDNWGYQTVFCNTNCFNKWQEQLSQYSCEWCKQNKSGKYWYNKVIHNGKEVISRKQKKFCSEQCLNYWKEHQQSTKENQIKTRTCIGSNCANQLTKNDISYCSTCIQKNEQALKNLEKTSQEMKEMVNDFNNKLTCQHTEIVYEENNPYFWFCQDCDDDSSPLFISKLQEDLVKDLQNDWFVKHNLTVADLKNSSFQFAKLNQKEFTNQKAIKQAYQVIEKELKELVSGKGSNNNKTFNINNKNNMSNPNMSERERSSIGSGKSNKGLYFGLGLGGLVLVGIIAYFLFRKNNKE